MVVDTALESHRGDGEDGLWHIKGVSKERRWTASTVKCRKVKEILNLWLDGCQRVAIRRFVFGEETIGHV